MYLLVFQCTPTMTGGQEEEVVSWPRKIIINQGIDIK